MRINSNHFQKEFSISFVFINRLKIIPTQSESSIQMNPNQSEDGFIQIENCVWFDFRLNFNSKLRRGLCLLNFYLYLILILLWDKHLCIKVFFDF